MPTVGIFYFQKLEICLWTGSFDLFKEVKHFRGLIIGSIGYNTTGIPFNHFLSRFLQIGIVLVQLYLFLILVNYIILGKVEDIIVMVTAMV